MAYGYLNMRRDAIGTMGDRPYKRGRQREKWDERALENPLMLCPLSGKECPGTKALVPNGAYRADEVRVCAAAAMLGGRCPLAAMVTLGARALHPTEGETGATE